MTTLNDAASSEQRESRRLALEDQLRQIEEEERRVAQDAVFCFNSSLPRLQERGSQSDLRDPSFTHPGSAIPNPAWGNVVEGLPSSKSSFSQSRQMSQSSYLPLQFHATLGQPSWAPLHGASSSRSPLPTTSISPSSTPQPPTPYTSGHQAVPVPSKAQVHDYLIKHMSMPQGLETGWLVNGQMFDVYTLLKTVLQMGGSSQVLFEIYCQ